MMQMRTPARPDDPPRASGGVGDAPHHRGSSAPSVAVFGIFGKTNLGNEASLTAFLANLRRRFPAGNVACVGPWDSDAESRYGLELVDFDPFRVDHHFWGYKRYPLVKTLASTTQIVTEPWRARMARKEMRRFDLLVMPGTGLLGDFGQGPLGMPYNLYRWCRAARKESASVCFLSVGAERADSPMSRRVLGRAAGLADYRSYRNDRSRENVREFGLTEAADDPIYPDLAFSLPKEMASPDRGISWPPREIGVGVMGYYGWNRPDPVGESIYQEYIGKLRDFVRSLLDRGHTVRLLIGDTRADERPVRDLVETFGESGDDRPGSGLVANPITSVDDLLEEISLTDMVVATRFHNVLLALLLGRPAVSVSYARKNEALMRRVGLDAYCQRIDDFCVDRLVTQFEELSGHREPPLDAARTWNEEARRQLDEQYDRVFSSVCGR